MCSQAALFQPGLVPGLRVPSPWIDALGYLCSCFMLLLWPHIRECHSAQSPGALLEALGREQATGLQLKYISLCVEFRGWCGRVFKLWLVSGFLNCS